ncbi:cold shock domain-containing protein [Streptomyces cocklensis]|jgi:CspA family cold shock protein|uniref:Cold-shock protein n=1 Tax=Actinacidiphila cocklensis TaxID=887465 RepID=A0A9W4GVZ9_9ACTN|nr:cold shock domain-containing protein [Actinacidiphila cocklensis]MDD1057750.1 cold shock domain-containing protein [Actinacidiphila cocklensis]WSX78738.1 cold shock domain-containing protein [Streptomyces sp. NBC_00899]CAG6398458.1 cold-shock protein [Actinacidiphila cocklensis]
MPTGTVKWFNSARGFGFIEQPGAGPDVFAHYSNFVDPELSGLIEGRSVTFEVTQTPKGLCAENIVCR